MSNMFKTQIARLFLILYNVKTITIARIENISLVYQNWCLYTFRNLVISHEIGLPCININYITQIKYHNDVDRHAQYINF